MPSLSFTPSPSLTEALLAQTTDPALTLLDIASRHQTTLEALTLWLTRPEIAERLESLHSFAVSRTRLLAATLLPKSIEALSQVLDNAKAELDEDKRRALLPFVSLLSPWERAG